nr:glycosyltransferase family 39 protein [Magnetospira sp. QH-2]
MIFFKAKHDRLFPAVLTLFGLSCALFYWSGRESLWLDEIIAITHGLQPFPAFFVEILRHDIHPALYFWILGFWSSLAFGSDKWILLSSVFFGVISCAVLYRVAWRIYGAKAALWAVGLFAVLPTFSDFTGNLRMYGLVPVIALICWYANREFLRTGSRGWLMGLLLIQFAQTYLHAIGFYFAAFFALAALVDQWPTTNGKRLRHWFLAQVVTMLFMLPVVGSALVRGTEVLHLPSFFSLIDYPARLMIPLGLSEQAMPWIGGLAFMVYASLGLREKATRLTVVLIPCLALLVCIAISALGRPMFKPPVFQANLIPFLALGAGVAVSRLGWGGIKVATVIACLVIAIYTGLWVQKPQRGENLKPAAQYLTRHVNKGDMVVIPEMAVFWGIMRYGVAPRWGYPLQIRPLTDNAAWTALKTKLGPKWVDRLGLIPRQDHIDHAGVRYVFGRYAAHHRAETPGRIWAVVRKFKVEDIDIEQEKGVGDGHFIGGELTVIPLVDRLR